MTPEQRASADRAVKAMTEAYYVTGDYAKAWRTAVEAMFGPLPRHYFWLGADAE